MRPLSDDSRRELEELRARLRRKALPRGLTSRTTAERRDADSPVKDEAGHFVSHITEEVREAERREKNEQATLRELHHRPRRWTEFDDERFDKTNAPRGDEPND